MKINPITAENTLEYSLLKILTNENGTLDFLKFNETGKKAEIELDHNIYFSPNLRSKNLSSANIILS